MCVRVCVGGGVCVCVCVCGRGVCVCGGEGRRRYFFHGKLHFLTGADVTPEHVLKLLQFLRLCSTAVQTGKGRKAA